MKYKLSRYAYLMVAVLALGLGGCKSLPSGTGSNANSTDADIISTSHEAAVALMNGAGTKVSRGPLLVASFANIDDLDKSSSFGRIVAQHFASAFASNNFEVVEMLLRSNVYIARQKGEFLLSREIRNLSMEHNATAVVVGTYAVGKEHVYVTAKLINAGNNTLLASYDYKLPIGPDTHQLLRR